MKRSMSGDRDFQLLLSRCETNVIHLRRTAHNQHEHLPGITHDSLRTTPLSQIGKRSPISKMHRKMKHRHWSDDLVAGNVLLKRGSMELIRSSMKLTLLPKPRG